MFDTEELTLDGLVIAGDVPAHDFPWFVPDSGPGSPDPLGDAIAS